MRRFMMTVMALSALFAASGKVHAEVNYPWCIIGDTRAIDCYFSSREQCMQSRPYRKPHAPRGLYAGQQHALGSNRHASQ
jgi:hypothetical protein